LAALILAAVAAGCFGGSHRTLRAADAVSRARADGYTDVRRLTPESWRCRGLAAATGPPETVGRYASYRRAYYAFTFGDKRLPNVDDNTAQIAMYVTVLPDAALAARCARATLYATYHVQATTGLRAMHAIRHRMLGPTTTLTHMHKPGAPGTLYPDDGTYQTSFSRGRVLAMGLAYTRPASLIVQADLERIAAQIAG
jgi:hypothetical protein